MYAHGFVCCRQDNDVMLTSDNRAKWFLSRFDPIKRNLLYIKTILSTQIYSFVAFDKVNFLIRSLSGVIFFLRVLDINGKLYIINLIGQ